MDVQPPESQVLGSRSEHATGRAGAPVPPGNVRARHQGPGKQGPGQPLCEGRGRSLPRLRHRLFLTFSPQRRLRAAPYPPHTRAGSGGPRLRPVQQLPAPQAGSGRWARRHGNGQGYGGAQATKNGGRDPTAEGGRGGKWSQASLHINLGVGSSLRPQAPGAQRGPQTRRLQA